MKCLQINGMDVEAELDSNWSVTAESVENDSGLHPEAENSKNNTQNYEPDNGDDDDKEEGEITDDENSQESALVTSSIPTKQEDGELEDRESDMETHVTSTNGAETEKYPAKARDVTKSPIRACTLVETVEKLRKTITFVILEKKKRGSSEDTSGEDTDKTSGRNEKGALGESDKMAPDTSDKTTEEDDEDEVNDGENDNEKDEQHEKTRDVKTHHQSKPANVVESSNSLGVDVTKDTDDDDSLRTLDPSSLSKSVMHLVDSVISENLTKESNTDKQTEVKTSPKSHIITSTPSSSKNVTPVVSSPVSAIVQTPKELDDQSAVLSYSHNSKLFKCDARTCGIKTNKEEVIKAHIEQHRGSRNVWYKCIYCKTITKNIENIRKHLQKFHVTDVLRFSKLNSPSIQDVYQSLIGEAKTETVTEPTEAKKTDSNLKDTDNNEQSIVIDDEDDGKGVPPRRSSTGSNVKPVPVIRRSSSDAAKANYTTKLECYYKDLYYRCKMCGFKSHNADTFASHAYYHLHGSDGKKGLANCGVANKPHDVADCTVVRGMMGLLKRQKESDVRSGGATSSKTTIISAGTSQQLTTQLQSGVVVGKSSKMFVPIQPKPTSTPVGKRLILIPTSQSPITNATQMKVTTAAAPSPIVIEPKDATPGFPPYKSPTTTKCLVSQTQRSETNASPIVIEPVDNDDKTTVNNAAAESKETAVSSTDKTDNAGVDPTLNSTSNHELKSIIDGQFESSVFTVSSGDNEVTVDDDEKETSKTRVLVKSMYKNGKFLCLTCNYHCPAVRPVTFRKHIWKDIHPKNECSHCAPDVMFNKFRNCPVMNKLMGLLEDAVEEEAEVQFGSQEAADENAVDMVIDLDTYSPEKSTKDAVDENEEPEKTDASTENSSYPTDMNKDRNDEVQKAQEVNCVTFHTKHIKYYAEKCVIK